ncbi:CapA family protein [Paenibacillus sp. LHD-117]|uniref:CapA family protein n=1 Tax=Paenibacillus sp. LHD-117 TaxID=3071412 RepID=UPI0027E0B939|nr:CapA family protein [Paenibacillus sp. LHD-117]MDQ6418157.1 CapA family protein [Paenibacillus sp. LHD-117]
MRKRKNKKTFAYVAFTILALLSIAFVFIWFLPTFTGTSINTPNATEIADSASPSAAPATETPSPTPDPTPAPPVFAEAVWMGVGDIMSHSPQLPGAYDAATGKYDFNPFFANVKPILEQGDWVMANLETPVAGESFGYSGYPTFNAPTELAEALRNAGFNLLSTANNHSLDKGEKGVLRTLEHLKALGLQAVGTASSQADADALIISEKNGIRMGLLAYTYGTNGIPIPEGKPYLVNLIDETKIKGDIKRLREAGADIVTVSLHFGTEYQTVPNESQTTLARALAAAGADIIAGSHPHVLQPYEVVDTFDEQGRPKQALIIYSMGNFISNQRGDSKDYGVIFKVNVKKNMSDKSVQLTEVEAIPTWVHRYRLDKSYRYRVLPVEATIAAADDKLLKPTDYEMLKRDFAMLTERLKSMK